MAEKRTLVCEECGHSWESTAKPENVKAGKIKCKKCDSVKIAEPVTAVVCHRCKGDKFWHSPRTGYRARTATEPLIDRSKPCSICKGTGSLPLNWSKLI